MTQKQWFGWSSAAVIIGLAAAIFWPKSEKKRAPTDSAAADGPGASAPIERRARDSSREAAVTAPRPALAAPNPTPTAASPTASEPEGLELADEPAHTDAERAQLARLPVIYAIRADFANDQARFDAMREALERSGPSTEPWTTSARSTFERWSSALKNVERSLDTESLRCYVAGCEMLVTFPDRATFEKGASEFRSIHEEVPVGRIQTPGVARPDGKVQASWMMLRPDVAPPPSEDAR